MPDYLTQLQDDNREVEAMLDKALMDLAFERRVAAKKDEQIRDLIRDLDIARGGTGEIEELEGGKGCLRKQK